MRLSLSLPKLAIHLLILGSLFSCGRDGETGGDMAMEFAVNESLLEAPVKLSSHGVSFRPPAGYSPVSQQLRDSVAQLLSAQKGGNLPVLAMYADSTTGAALLISDLSDIPAEAYGEWLADIPNQYAPPAQVRQAAFVYKDFRIVQFLISDQRQAAFRLVFDKGVEKRFEAYYVAPLSVYAQEARKFESSIGSFEKLP